MTRVCRLALIAFLAAYAIALGAYVVGAFGLFSQERDPLSGVFLIPLGLPWNLAVDAFPEPTWPWLAASAPALNVALLWLVCSALPRRRATPSGERR